MPVSKKPRKKAYTIKQTVKTVVVELPKQLKGSHVIVLPKNEEKFLKNHPNPNKKDILVERTYKKKVYSQIIKKRNPTLELNNSYEARMKTLKEAKYVGIAKGLNEGHYTREEIKARG